MLIPKGMTENEVVFELDKVINSLFKDIKHFGYFDSQEEIRQQAYLFGIEAINTGKYDENRPLGGFLRTCIINRFISLSRDRYCRNEPPCHKCPFFDKDKKKSESGCLAFDDKLKCEKYKAYFKRNKTKRDLMNLKGETNLFDDSLSRNSKDLIEVDNRDLITNICSKLSPTSKETLANLLAENKVKKHKLDKLREEIANAGTTCNESEI